MCNFPSDTYLSDKKHRYYFLEWGGMRDMGLGFRELGRDAGLGIRGAGEEMRCAGEMRRARGGIRCAGGGEREEG